MGKKTGFDWIITIIIILFIVLFALTALGGVVYLIISYGKNREMENFSMETPRNPDIKYYDDMSEGEKVQWITKALFSPSIPEDELIKRQIERSNKLFKEKLPESRDCSNLYNECQKWADGGECEVNPEFMLYNCPSACKACKLTEDEKYRLVSISNQNPPKNCVYHGKNYPGNFPYLYRLYKYDNPKARQSAWK